MGFLGGLFEKKNCDVCGNKIGLLGNRKLEDGNLCKDCAAKLSPWFSERRHSTLAEIREQLAYREANKAKVSAFEATRTFGKYYKIYLDDYKKQFMVSSAGRLEEANPDVLDFKQITGVDLDVKENRMELKQKNSEGKSVSYDPPRYEFSYNFYCTIHVNAPYFDDMNFQLNSGVVKTGEQAMTGNQNYSGWNMSSNSFSLRNGVNEYYEYINLGNEIKEALEQARMTGQLREETPAAVSTYEKLKNMTPEEFMAEQNKAIEEAKAALAKKGLAPDDAATIAAASAALAGAAPAAAQVKCPWCGSMTSSASGKCQFCDGELN